MAGPASSGQPAAGRGEHSASPGASPRTPRPGTPPGPARLPFPLHLPWAASRQGPSRAAGPGEHSASPGASPRTPRPGTPRGADGAGPAPEPAGAGDPTAVNSAPAAGGTAAAGGPAGTDRPEGADRTAEADGPVAAAAVAAPSAGLRAVFAALAANLGIAATKFIAFAITGSASMLAESVHSVADSGNQVLLLLGRNRASRARTEEHPFGYGRERYFYAFVVAVVLFTVGALFSIYEGVHKITHPEPVRNPAVAFVVLGIAIVLESFSLRTALRESSEQREGHGWLAFIRRAKAPELPVILLEDMKSLLIGESASAEVERAIVAALEDGAEVERVIHLRTLHMGPESLLVAAKIAVRPCDRAETVVAGIDAAERRVRAAVPIARVIYLEPDLYYAARADTTDPAIRAVQRRPRR